jgi:type III pantothenate kinase
MLLAIDIGNTSVKFGVFDNEELISRFSIPTTQDVSSAEIAAEVGANLNLPVSDAIVCSVVPVLNKQISEYAKAAFAIDPFFVTNDLDLGLAILYEPLTTLGTDRIVNSFSAAEKYGVPCIVCSFGTATTVDAVSHERELLGGLIAPGFVTMARALDLNTANLHEVDIDRPENVINNTTTSSIQAGIFYSQVGLIESVVGRVKNELAGDVKVIATGGFSWAIADACDCIDVTDQNLTLEGLRMIYLRQKA